MNICCQVYDRTGLHCQHLLKTQFHLVWPYVSSVCACLDYRFPLPLGVWEGLRFVISLTFFILNDTMLCMLGKKQQQQQLKKQKKNTQKKNTQKHKKKNKKNPADNIEIFFQVQFVSRL